MGRAFDLAVSSTLLLVTLPLWPLIAVAIFVSDPGPVFFTSRRAGLGGTPFNIHKFRTMRVHRSGGARITSRQDARIFPLGRYLRLLKLDELPQLWDVLCGNMSIVGPRPEDVSIVENHYSDAWRETLLVKPGLTSPGTLYYYSLAENEIPEADPEEYYLEEILPTKMEIDRYYVQNANLFYDVRVCWRTFVAIVRMLAGMPAVRVVPEMTCIDTPSGSAG